MTEWNAIDELAVIVEQIEAAPELERLRSLDDKFSVVDKGTCEAILGEAARFSEEYLSPLNASADKAGCILRDGKVTTPTGFSSAWKEFVKGGWPTLDHPVEQGGQDLPLFLSVSVQQLIDSSCTALGMLPVLQRSAARLLAAYGAPWMKEQWLPQLVSGEWGATICISEADAGSDVARIRTRAEPCEDGSWSITGEKMWISFGDHDLTPRIGHCLLAKTNNGGLSLFLVPDRFESPGGELVENTIVVRRVEEKLGLHGSPTCALGFEQAKGWLIGTEGRGLAQMFVMITNMRLSAGIQGLSLASLSASVALNYARQRRQGGDLTEPPLMIVEHADVQRQLLEMVSQVEVLRGLGVALAIQVDLVNYETDADRKKSSSALLQWLLPIFKTLGGEAGFDVASKAIQVLGGAGYTREWPVEQALRDSRIFTIYEGTTGIQALDLVHRRLWRDGGTGLNEFITIAQADLDRCDEVHGRPMAKCLVLLQDAANFMLEQQGTALEAESGATAFLHLAGLAATGWIATRLVMLEQKNPALTRLYTAGAYWLAGLEEHATLFHAQAIKGAEHLKLSINL
ncbi:MAG: acyl-CoA dehydrogenase family protein [Spongiibacteraceae bacterium]